MADESQGPNPRDDSDDYLRANSAGRRKWNDFWTWRDKPIGEHGAALETASDDKFILGSNLRSGHHRVTKHRKNPASRRYDITASLLPSAGLRTGRLRDTAPGLTPR
jgi:hypothetical protein